MLGSFQQAFKVGDLKRKLLFTLFMLLVFRFGAHIPVPGINPRQWRNIEANYLGFFFDINFFGGI